MGTTADAATQPEQHWRQHVAVGLAGLLLAAHGLIPPIWGDVYPFTTGPMFRDSPSEFCNYRVFDLDGRELSSRDWHVERIYDGNPLGYGVGVRPPAVLESMFGAVQTQEQVRQHLMEELQRPEHRNQAAILVVQQVIGPINSDTVGVLKENRWKISK